MMKVKLGDVCNFYAGTGFPVAYQGKDSGELPFYKVGDIANNVSVGKTYLELCKNYISREDARVIKGVIVPKGTVVFAKIGEALKLNRRAITSCDCLIDNNAMGIAPISTFLREKYFFYYMKHLKMQELAETTTVPSVRKSKLEAVIIEVPTIQEQEKIEKQLDKISDIIEVRKQQLQKLDELVKARFVEMFGEPETNPYEWRKDVLAKHLNVVGGYAFKSELFEEKGIPVLRIGNINAGFFQPINMVYWKYDESLSRYMMHTGDLVMSLTGTVGKDDYGNVCILGDDYDCYYLNQRNAKLELFSTLNKYYLSQVLKFSEVKRKLTGISRGVRQANISNKDILNLEIPIPPIELQNEFATFVEQVDKSKVAVQKALDEAQTLFDSLMQEYFG